MIDEVEERESIVLGTPISTDFLTYPIFPPNYCFGVILVRGV
jgi:hypothetical protein